VVDLGPLNAAISVERTTREGMDGALHQQIIQESDARKAADDELRASVNETRIAGRYAFSGTQSCLNSTFGFNDDLTPRASTDPNRAAVVGTNFSVTTGFRTFNEDGSGTAEFSTQSISYPGMFMTSSGFTGFATNGPGRPGGNASSSVQTGTFSWEVVNGKLFITDTSGAAGPFTSGSSMNCTVRTDGTPRAVGVLGKDLKTISVSHDGVAVETLVITCANSTPSSMPRICHRERLLRKM
jgi:hypothetical protein